MFIDGMLVNDSDDIAVVIEALKNLPPIFLTHEGIEQVKHNFSSPIPFNQEFDALNQQANTMASNAYSEWNTSGNEGALQHFVSIRQSAATACDVAGQPLAAAEHLLSLGYICNTANRGQHVIEELDKAVSIFEQYRWNIKLYTALGELHRSIVKAISVKEESGEFEGAQKLRNRLRPIRQKSLEAYHQLNNEPVNPQARRVTQRQVAFSGEEPLGSNNISECVCLMIGDPITGKIAEVHFDERTIESSLQTLFKYMTPPTDSHPWQIQIMGGGGNLEVGYENVKKVVSFFRRYPVNFVKQAILKKNQPTAATFYPKTFEVRQEAPPIEGPNGLLADAKTRLGEEGPLDVALDTTKSKKRAPVLLSANEVADLKLYGNDDKTISATVVERFDPSNADLPGVIEEITQLVEAHQRAANDVVVRLTAKMNLFKTHPQLRELNVEFDRNAINEVVRRIHRHAIHIGDGAKEANQPLMDFITKTNQLITITKGPGGKNIAKFDFDGFDRIGFTRQPYETIKVQSPSSPKQGR